MAWTDVLQGQQASLGNTLNRRQGRRESSLNRLSNALSRLGAQKFTTGEREDTQEFENTQARTAAKERLKLQGAIDTSAMERLEFGEGAAGGRQETELAARAALQDDAQAFEKSLYKSQSEDELEQLRLQNEARMAELEAQLDAPRTVYDQPFTVIDPKTGEEKMINSDLQGELWLAELEGRRIADQIRLQAALRDSGSDSDSGRAMEIFDIEFGKQRAANPDIWEKNGAWGVKLDQEALEAQRQHMLTSLMVYTEDGQLDEAAIGNLMAIWDGYVTALAGNVPGAGGGDSPAELRTSGAWNTWGEPSTTITQVPGSLSGVPAALEDIGLLFNRDRSISDQASKEVIVTPEERDIWERLRSLGRAGNEQARTYFGDVSKPGFLNEEERVLWEEIQEWLSRIGTQGL